MHENDNLEQLLELIQMRTEVAERGREIDAMVADLAEDLSPEERRRIIREINRSAIWIAAATSVSAIREALRNVPGGAAALAAASAAMIPLAAADTPAITRTPPPRASAPYVKPDVPMAAPPYIAPRRQADPRDNQTPQPEPRPVISPPLRVRLPMVEITAGHAGAPPADGPAPDPAMIPPVESESRAVGPVCLANVRLGRAWVTLLCRR